MYYVITLVSEPYSKVKSILEAFSTREDAEKAVKAYQDNNDRQFLPEENKNAELVNKCDYVSEYRKGFGSGIKVYHFILPDNAIAQLDFNIDNCEVLNSDLSDLPYENVAVININRGDLIAKTKPLSQDTLNSLKDYVYPVTISSSKFKDLSYVETTDLPEYYFPYFLEKICNNLQDEENIEFYNYDLVKKILNNHNIVQEYIEFYETYNDYEFSENNKKRSPKRPWMIYKSASVRESGRPPKNLSSTASNTGSSLT